MMHASMHARRLRPRGGAAWILALAIATPAAAAQPSDVPGDSGPPARDALDAATGVPPAGAQFTSDTQADPGFVERAAPRAADRTYGPSSQRVASDGSIVEGVQLQDYESLMPSDAGYGEDLPSFHVVGQGDTLWAISGSYLGDPYLWPKLWSWNEQITNAHWIFPGDRVRLRDPRQGAQVTASGDTFDFRRPSTLARQEPKTYLLSQMAFVTEKDFDTSMKVIGGGDAKVMMATFDTAYLSYVKDKPPIPGERLVVYAPTEKVRGLKGREVVGYVVQIMGEVEIDAVAREAAEGKIVNALNPVERGFRVGPLRRMFRRVETTPAERSASGFVIATLTTTGPIAIQSRQPRREEQKYTLAGDEQYIIVDLGEKDGVQVGNVLEIVQKGDAYTKKRVFAIPYEDGWPRRLLGKAVIVDVQEETSLAAVTYARQEFERGDHVELRGPGLHTPEESRAMEAGAVHRVDVSTD